jgi:hypothetical protein
MGTRIIETISATQAIQLILAPGVMINACGLLLLSISSKFTTVLNRIRALTEEKRKLTLRAGNQDFSPMENQRLESVTRQITGLMTRAQYIRNAVSCYFCAVGLFVVTSLTIGIDYFMQVPILRLLSLGTFLFGMITVFLGVIFGMRDTFKGFDVVKFEVQADE